MRLQSARRDRQFDDLVIQSDPALVGAKAQAKTEQRYSWCDRQTLNLSEHAWAALQYNISVVRNFSEHVNMRDEINEILRMRPVAAPLRSGGLRNSERKVSCVIRPTTCCFCLGYLESTSQRSAGRALMHGRDDQSCLLFLSVLRYTIATGRGLRHAGQKYGGRNVAREQPPRGMLQELRTNVKLP